MEIREHGFRKGDYYLGQKVNIESSLYTGEGIIIGFSDEKIGNVACYLAEENMGYTGKLMGSMFVKDILKGYENFYNWLWFDLRKITPIEKSEKEDVLKIKVQEINKDYSAIEIVYQNEEVLKRGEFKDSELNIKSVKTPEYTYNTLYIKGDVEVKDNKPFIVYNKDVPHILKKVEAINEKYGIKRRWRAEKGEAYYFVCSNIEVSDLCDNGEELDNELYDLGNYYKTREEAEVIAEKIKQIYKG